jgi:hypothetical protein
MFKTCVGGLENGSGRGRGGGDLGNPALHDEEVRVVDVELYALEQSLDSVLLGLVSVEEVF